MGILTRDEFEKLVVDAIRSLPKHIRQKMDNVAVVVEDAPTAEQLKKGRVKGDRLLLGLYEGVPRTRRGLGYNLALPDKITIFQNSIEAVAPNPELMKQEVQKTVWHEFAHHFGFSEDDIKKLEK